MNDYEKQRIMEICETNGITPDKLSEFLSIKPCKFCGGTKTIVKTVNGVAECGNNSFPYTEYYIECVGSFNEGECYHPPCRASGPRGSTPLKAIELWNREKYNKKQEQ
jgi:hypothetical protein